LEPITNEIFVLPEDDALPEVLTGDVIAIFSPAVPTDRTGAVIAIFSLSTPPFVRGSFFPKM
jgi:hypothetical protein